MKKVHQIQEDNAGIQLVFESLTNDHLAIVQADAEKYEDSRLLRLIRNVCSILLPDDLHKTRIVLTADFIGSVNSRHSEPERPYTTERGSGRVAGKTMSPNEDGLVDILFPLYILVPHDDPDIAADVDRHVEHVAKHEAVHARLYHLGTHPFDAYRREEEFGYATKNFIMMAGEQAEEHLSEGTAVAKDARKNWADAKAIDGALTALTDTLASKLPIIPKDTQDYYRQAMLVAFSALRILWISLAFLAAELRTGNSFQDLPDEISQLPAWNQYVAPWWDEYLCLLGKVPLSFDIDIPKTDKTVKEIAAHLQRWAKGIGFDFHDMPNGESWFGITQ